MNPKPKTNHRPHPPLLIALCSLLFVTCSNSLSPPPEEMPPGTGSFTLHLANNAARTILPNAAPQLADIDSLTIIFAGPKNDQRTIENFDSSEPIKPITLPVGKYELTVYAYLPGDLAKVPPVPVGRSDKINVTINPGSNPPKTVTLKALLHEGSGSFAWDITIGAGVTVNPATAKLIITKSGGAEAYNETLTMTGNKIEGSITGFDSGLYTVTFDLDGEIAGDGNHHLLWNELLYVYSALESKYTKTFTENHFRGTHWDVIFVFNDGVTGNGTETVMNGETVNANNSAPMPDPEHAKSYHFDGWFTKNGSGGDWGTEWNLNAHLVHDNMTLYAKWTANRASIELEVANIEKADPAIAGLPITIYRSGTPGGMPSSTATVTAPDGYAWYKWEIGGINHPDVLEEGAAQRTFTLDATDVKYNTLGGHALRLTVTKNGIAYQVNIPFTVEG